MAVKTYDPAAVKIILGNINVSGYADGTFVACGRDNPSWTSGTGADGEGWRAKSNDRSGTCTVTLLQTSGTNDAFSALALLDEETGDGVAPLLVKDLNGTTLYAAQTAWLEKPADSEMAREKSDREWAIKTDNLQVFVGGN